MIATFLSFLSLLFSWAAGYLFALVIVQVVHASGMIHMPLIRVFRPAPKESHVKGLQKLFFTLILVGLALLLSKLLDPESTVKLLKGYLQNYLDLQLTQTLMQGVLSNVLLILGVFILYQTMAFINALFPRAQTIIEGWRHTRFKVLKLKSMELVTPDQITDFLLSLTRYVQVGLNLALIVTGLTYVLSFFSGTQQIAVSIMERLTAILHSFGQAILGFIPNLLTLFLILLGMRYILKLLHFFHEGVQSDKIRILGLPKDLAEPTYQLLRVLIIALALVAAYPYVPGSDSPVFRGITIFVGFLLSMGSTSLVTNIVSGVVLTYTRGLRIGDRVKIGNTTGDVVERTLLVTRVRTIKNVIVSIPNSMVLNNEIENYSAITAREGLILHTSVTIGYDVPWRKVNDLLIRSALTTRSILQHPAPFVLQTSLDDYYVSYELNAYTHDPKRMALIYSELHQNIQDQFNMGGVEIMSPAYMAYRDGGASTMVAIEQQR